MFPESAFNFSPSKTEPSSDARTFAGAVRQMFVALTDEGFTEAQALSLVGTILAANTGGAS